MVKEFVYNCNGYEYGIVFENDSCYIWDESGDHREGGPIVVRYLDDVLNLEDTDKKFREAFLDKIKPYESINPKKYEEVIKLFNALPFNSDPEYYNKLHRKLIRKYYVLKNKNRHLEWKITARRKNYDDIYNILKRSSNYRKNDKPRLKGSGDIWEVGDYSWINPKTNKVEYFSYQKLILHAGYDCKPEPIFSWDAEWRRVTDKATIEFSDGCAFDYECSEY